MLTRREIVIAVATACVTVAAVSLGQSPGRPIMHSCVFDLSKAKVQETGVGTRRALCQARTATLDELECHVTTLNPGQASHAPHKHFPEEIVILTEGTLEALQGDETTRVEAGSVIFEGSNELHAVKNVGDRPATYYVFQWRSPGLRRTVAAADGDGQAASAPAKAEESAADSAPK